MSVSGLERWIRHAAHKYTFAQTVAVHTNTHRPHLFPLPLAATNTHTHTLTHTHMHLHKPRNVSKGIIPPQRCEQCSGGDQTGEQGGQWNTGLNRAIQSQTLPSNNVPWIHSTQRPYHDYPHCPIYNTTKLCERKKRTNERKI